MIPTEEAARALWDTHHLPDTKRLHVELVARVAVFLARELETHTPYRVNKHLLFVAALLHDIDKAVPPRPGERHPDTGVRILREAGMDEVADIVVTHPLHSILDARIAPKTWEEKLLYLADKMVKFEVITVDKRFALWRAENLPAEARRQLDASYPKVKELEKEVFGLVGMTPEGVPAQISGDACLQNYSRE